MAKKITDAFTNLVGLATQFVQQQKGSWDHQAWLDFLANVRQEGHELTEDMQRTLGGVMESMKGVYQSTLAAGTIGDALQELAQLTATFVKQQRGTWDHQAFEAFIEGVQQKGVEVTQETQRYLGGILESTKRLYTSAGPGDADAAEQDDA